jgi:formylglycine-generating enzyme required for sulfatase activity
MSWPKTTSIKIIFITTICLFCITGFGIAQDKGVVPVDMVFIKGGSFLMGHDSAAVRSKPGHKVTLDSFYMDKYEVTQGDFVALMGLNPSYFKGDNKRPVEKVTWYDAVLYCNARSKKDGLSPVYHYTGILGTAGNGCKGLDSLEIDYSKNGYRLPTEAEWEYTFNAGAMSRPYRDDKFDEAYSWGVRNSGNQTNTVGRKKPNAWGLYDMAGNVYEWCNDWYELFYYKNSPEKNPHGPDAGELRVYRGGSWNQCLFYGLKYNRDKYSPRRRNYNLGFRCVTSGY